MNRDLRRYQAVLGVAVGAVLLPLAAPGDYSLHLAIMVGINAIVVLGLNLLMGYAGQVSLGQAAFVGLGAYASAVLTVKAGLSPWLAMPAGVSLAALTGAVVGVPLLKLRGHYLAMGTLGFGMIVYIMLVQWEGITEGTIGIMSIPPLVIGSVSFASARHMYYLVAGSVIACLALAANIIDSRIGRAMRAVHGSEIAAETSGIDTARFKLQVFILSAAMAGYAGCLYAHHTTYVHPYSFEFHRSVSLVVMGVLGGMASTWGAIFGAAAVTIISENLRHFQEFSTIFFGLALVVIMIFMPAGLWRGADDLLRRSGVAARLSRRRPRKAAR